MKGLPLKERIPSSEMRKRLNVNPGEEELQKRRLNCCGNVQRRSEDESVKKGALIVEKGRKSTEHPKNMWIEKVEKDTECLGLHETDTMDRAKWRNANIGTTT